MVEAQTQPGGLSPGLASRLRLADGRRFFVKAVSEEANPDSPNIHRREAEIMAVLPPRVPAPRLLWTYDDGGWVALCFDDVDGRHPQEPWTGSDLARVVEALKAMAVALTPSPIALEYTASQAFTRRLVHVGRFDAEGVHAAVHVGVGVGIEVDQRVNDLSRLLGGGRVIEINQWSPIDLALEDREVGANAIDVQRAGLRTSNGV